jgi:hypothetical protein
MKGLLFFMEETGIMCLRKEEKEKIIKTIKL